MHEEIYYQCQRCTNCCRWPGLVKITDADITAMAEHLGMTDFEFVQQYTKVRPYRDGLALLDKDNGECIFLDGRDCIVQPAKPSQCAGFPNTWNFAGWREKCEAVPTLRAVV
jgi:Fe-S-cluster containining protein